MQKTLTKPLTALLLGCVAAFILLETSLQAVHLYNKLKLSFSNTQKPNKQQKDTLTIMCIGESVTAGISDAKYPSILQEILKFKAPSLRVNVINKGVHKSTVYMFVQDMDYYLQAYSPDIVIAMIGINDIQSVLTKDHVKTRIKPAKWYAGLRSAYLFKSLFLSLKEKKSQHIKPSTNLNKTLKKYWETGTYSYFLLGDFAILDRQMLKQASTPLQTAFWKAKTEANEGNTHTALLWLLEAAKLNINIADIYALAAIYMRVDPENNNLIARQILQLAIPSTPQNQYITSGVPNIKKILQTLKKQCEINTKSRAKFLRCWGRWHHQYEFNAQAAKTFKQGVQTCPNNTLEFNALYADTLRRAGKTSQALEIFENVLTQDPSNLLALRGLAYYYSRNDPGKKEQKYLLECIKHYPNFRDAYETLGIRYYQEGKLEQARPLLEKAVALDPNIDSSGTKLLAKIYAKTKNTDLLYQNNKVFIRHYRKILKTLAAKNIQLIAMQYPMRNIDSLKNVFTPEQQQKIVFANNTPAFKKALNTHSYDDLFIDHFAGNFGHLTKLGCQLTANTAARAVNTVLKRKNRPHTSI